MPLPDRIASDRFAIFLDFDGTLVDLAERPDLVQVTEETLCTLRALNAHYGGAIAIITGRDIETVDAFLSPLKLPVAGVHGLMRRDARGGLHVPAYDPGPLASLEEALRPLIQREAGLLLEKKRGALVLHYRQRPDLENVARKEMAAAAADFPSISLRMGKMVIEAVGYPTDKGRAIESFMDDPPFIGRTPLFAGDDVTDEDGFAVVNGRGGLSIKVGAGDTAARHRVADRDTLIAWFKLVLKNSGYAHNG